MTIKVILSTYLFFNWFLFGVDSKPEKIPSKLIKIEAKAWYKEKVRSWKNYLENNPNDKEGWLEYFKASVYAGEKNDNLKTISDKINVSFNDSYEAFYSKAILTGWNAEGVKLIRQAVQKNNKKQKLLPEQILLAEIDLDRKTRKSFSKILLDSKSIYPSLLNYSYNVLMSVRENGVLIVQGEPASIPIWMLQDVLNIRPDVKLLNIDLAENITYLAKWMTENDLIGGDLIASNKGGDLIKELPNLNPERAFYYGLTLADSKINTIEKRLYVVGLASLHKKEQFDNYEVLKENIENKFLIDYLTLDFNGEPKSATGKVYETNYILPFLLLKEYYDEIGNSIASENWKQKILTLADRSQIKNRVAMLMQKSKKKEGTKSFVKIEIPVKELDKKLMKIKNNLYASQYEITNKEYWFYLDYLYKNGFGDLYEKSLADLSKYDQFTATLLDNYHYSPVNNAVANKYKDNSFMDYPAIDMSFEAAKTYCEWLTFQYNEQENRKYKKVRFRLPTRKEWSIAALGYKDFTSWELEENTIKAYSNWKKNKKDLKSYKLSEHKVLYPWWHPNINFSSNVQNEKGCYLANVKAKDEIACPAGIKGDGYTLMSTAGSYFANGMGLYDVIGNVCEMINEDGKAMGGSWNHEAKDCTISSVNNYSGSDASVGFRVFMEVIEE